VTTDQKAALRVLSDRSAEVPDLERAAESVLVWRVFGMPGGPRLVEVLARSLLVGAERLEQSQAARVRLETKVAQRDGQTCRTCGWRKGERCVRLDVPCGAVGFCKCWRAKE
jgi:hypothetical protein